MLTPSLRKRKNFQFNPIIRTQIIIENRRGLAEYSGPRTTLVRGASCSTSCASVNVDGFTSPSPSSAINRSHVFAAVSVQLSVQSARASAARAQAQVIWTHLKTRRFVCVSHRRPTHPIHRHLSLYCHIWRRGEIRKKQPVGDIYITWTQRCYNKSATLSANMAAQRSAKVVSLRDFHKGVGSRLSVAWTELYKSFAEFVRIPRLHSIGGRVVLLDKSVSAP
jgi:hypothetical protein